LTTKFTRHTQAGSWLLAFGFWLRTNPNTPLKFYGPLLLLIARLTPINVYAHQQLLSGTHKNLQRLVFAQSIQLSNIVLISLLAYSETDYPACAGMGLTKTRVCKLRNSSNPMFGVKTTLIEP
jgi:hypothetical protein